MKPSVWMLITFSALWSPVTLALPDIQHWQTENGSRVYFVQAAELPIVDLQISFDAGSSRDGDKPGLAALTNGLLIEGAGGVSTDELLERFAHLGAIYGHNVDRDSASLSLRSLSKADTLQTALDTLALILSQPDFPPVAIERDRKSMLQVLAYNKQDTGSLASDAFYKALYGEHPYAIDDNGTEASVKAISRDDITAFFRRHYLANGATISIVGDLDKAAAQAVAEQLSQTLPQGEALPPLPAPPALSQAAQQHIEHPSTQTHVLLGQVGYQRGDPDHFALYLGNHILGGSGLVSRLSQEVREKRGLSYSVYSYFSPLRVAGPFVIGLQTRNDQSEQAVQLVRDEVRRFIEQGPTEEELQAAKKNLSGGFALRLDSNAKLLSYLDFIGFYQLPLDYLHTWVANIEQVSREQVRDAFRRHLDPDKLLLVTVGGDNSASPTAQQH